MSTVNDIFIIRPETSEQRSIIKALMKAMKIKFEVSKEEKSPYNNNFVEKIKRSQQNFKEGKGRVVSSEDLDNLWK
jgi:hypothetical protein